MLVHVVTESTHKIARKLWDNSGHFLVQFLESTRAIWLAECIILLLILDVCSNGLFLLFCFFFMLLHTVLVSFTWFKKVIMLRWISWSWAEWISAVREVAPQFVCKFAKFLHFLERYNYCKLPQTVAICSNIFHHMITFFESHEWSGLKSHLNKCLGSVVHCTCGALSELSVLLHVNVISDCFLLH